MKPENLVFAVVGIIVRVAVVIGAVYIIYNGAVRFYDYGYRIFTEPAVSVGGTGREITLTIDKDMDSKELAEMFYEKGLTRDANLFRLQYLFSEHREDIKSGTYTLTTAMTAEEMFETMTGGEEDENAPLSTAGASDAAK
ncbi:MAG: endolytic transglycosylase MltG [Lachnospiraceae bacterium]|nr:endolytic transglycosylase MltG [Lachnospiraceae bacterium]